MSFPEPVTSYVRMVIGECLSAEQIQAFTDIYRDLHLPELNRNPLCLQASLAVEESGNMVVHTTRWKDRAGCLNHHSSRSYRQFVANTQHLLAGSFVVKLFKQEDYL